MNLHPKVRPLWQRILALPMLVAMMTYKVLGLPKKILPRALRSIATHWDYSMFGMLIKSGITRAYIDHPCEFKTPTTFEPKVSVEPKYQLGEEKIKQFYKDGFLGPLDAFFS